VAGPLRNNVRNVSKWLRMAGGSTIHSIIGRAFANRARTTKVRAGDGRPITRFACFRLPLDRHEALISFCRRSFRADSSTLSALSNFRRRCVTHRKTERQPRHKTFELLAFGRSCRHQYQWSPKQAYPRLAHLRNNGQTKDATPKARLRRGQKDKSRLPSSNDIVVMGIKPVSGIVSTSISIAIARRNRMNVPSPAGSLSVI